jgi:hypothetical protein
MDGFHFIQSTTCIIFLFQSWVLDTGGKYALAFLGTILIGIGLEKLIQQRRKVMGAMGAGRKRLVVSATFYGIQLTIGYMLMLIIMIYSGALFMATVLGLVSGHVFFNASDAIWPLQARPSTLMILSPENETDDGSFREEPNEVSERTLAPAASANCPVEMTTVLTNPSTRLIIPPNTTHKKDWEVDTAVPAEDGQDISCCGNEPTAGVTIDPGKHLIPEGSTPCCQYSSCD